MSTRMTLEKLILKVAEAIRPPERLTVSEAAEKYRYIYNPGSYVGKWNNNTAPYLVEVMDEMTSPDFTGLIFAGPARCGKSDPFFNLLAHTAICDPKDIMLIHMTQATSRDWSQGDLKKVFRHSKQIGARVMPGRQNSNVHDVKFLSGMRLLIKWPTITELSGKTIPLLWLMDMDRMPQDVGGEGNVYDLARKRATTYGRNGMCIAESSPGFEIKNSKWLAETNHQAPPTDGILSLYNRGDRRRWYWRCIECKEPFEGDFKNLSWPDSRDHREAADMVTMDCPVCGYSHTHEQGPGQPGKHGLNIGGKWIKDGMVWLPDNSVGGEQAIRSDIASFWLKGTAAAFSTWSDLTFKYLKAMEEYELTGSTKSLKTTVNTDQGHPFSPPKQTGDLLPEELKSRAIDFGDKVVPPWVRFLLATIDIQKNKFVVQVHGIGTDRDITVIDRFDINKSTRKDEDGERLWVSPSSHIEDWYLLIEVVIEKTYPLADSSGRHMKIKNVACDSGGRDGVTGMAYNFWRYLRDDHAGLHHQRFQLLKGDPREGIPRSQIRFPDTDRKDRHAGARGEIPVMFLNSNVIKDQVLGMLQREERGGNVVFPKWLPSSFYTELTVEVRTTKGWENPKKYRNESWDLLYYCVGLMLSRHVQIERINWEMPPSWADEWDRNDLVFNVSGAAPFTPEKSSDVDFAKLGDELA